MLEFASLLRGYNIRKITSDRYAGAWVQEAFEKEGIKIEYSDLSASDLYLNLLPELNNRSLELPDNSRLKAQLQGLMRKSLTGGRDRVIADPGLSGHSDLANALAGMVFVIAEGDRRRPGVESVKAFFKKATDTF